MSPAGLAPRPQARRAAAAKGRACFRKAGVSMTTNGKDASDIIPAPQAGIITIPEEIAVIRTQWLESKVVELARAKDVLRALREMKAGPAKIVRAANTVAFLKKIVKALEHGYIPIPRFQAHTLRLDVEELPVKVIVALNAARAGKFFSEVRLADGESPGRGFGRRRPARDPVLIGVIRTPNVLMNPGHSEWIRDEVWAREEHFMIAWWRPEDERPEEMF